MKLYVVSTKELVPAYDPVGAVEDAANKISDMDYEEIKQKCEVVELVNHVEFVKIFRLARYLDATEQYGVEEEQMLIRTYAEKLLNKCVSMEIVDSFIHWAERLEDSSDEDIEGWIN